MIIKDGKDKKKEAHTEEKMGFLVMKLKSGEGVMVEQGIEFRLCAVHTEFGEAQIAVRAPKHLKIRRLD